MTETVGIPPKTFEIVTTAQVERTLAMTETVGIPPKTFEIVTTAQVERTYVVQAKDIEQAQARLRTHLKDADMLRDGVVVEQPSKQTDTTPQRIKAAKS